MTDITTTDTLGLTPDTLTLVVVSPDYFDTGEHHHLMPNEDDDSRTYYATTSRSLPGSHGAIVVGPTDPRGDVGWLARADFDNLGLGEGHRGWNIPMQYLTPVDQTPTPDPDRPLAVGDRVRVTEEHPNVNWRGETGDVETADDSRFVAVRMVTGSHVGALGSFDSRYLERVTPDETTSSSDRTYSQEEVDALLAQERREAADALERFKEHANGIAVQYAKDNDLCGNFERCMADIGLMGREEWDEAHRRTYRVTVEVLVDVEADDEEDALERGQSRVYNGLASDIDDYVTATDATLRD